MIRGILVEEFQEAGWIAFGANDGVRGAELNKKHRPLAIISDIRMPGGSGIDLIKELKRANEMPQIFYFASAYSDVSEDELKSLGAKGLITKPFMLDALVKLLDKEFEKLKSSK